MTRSISTVSAGDAIEFNKVDFQDNQECLSRFEKIPRRFFSLMDEESKLVKASDITLFSKLKHNLSGNSCYKCEQGGNFTVRHYAGKVPLCNFEIFSYTPQRILKLEIYNDYLHMLHVVYHRATYIGFPAIVTIKCSQQYRIPPTSYQVGYIKLFFQTGQVVVEIPYMLIMTLLFFIITYPLIGFYWTASKLIVLGRVIKTMLRFGSDICFLFVMADFCAGTYALDMEGRALLMALKIADNRRWSRCLSSSWVKECSKLLDNHSGWHLAFLLRDFMAVADSLEEKWTWLLENVIPWCREF